MKLKKILPLLLLLCSSLYAFEETFVKTFEVNPGADFSLSSHKGTIRVSTDNGDTVRIKARIYVEAGEDDRAIQYTEIDTHARADYVSVKVDYNQKKWKDMWSDLVGDQVQTPFVDFDIIIPDDLNLRLESHKSEFEINAPAGTVRIQSHKGEGYIKNVRNHFELESHKGEFDVEILAMRDLEIETHKGEMDVTIHKATDFTIRGTTHKGDLAIRGREVRYQAEKRGRGMHLKESFGKGTNRVRLDTHKGNITLNFVD